MIPFYFILADIMHDAADVMCDGASIMCIEANICCKRPIFPLLENFLNVFVSSKGKIHFFPKVLKNDLVAEILMITLRGEANLKVIMIIFFISF